MHSHINALLPEVKNNEKFRTISPKSGRLREVPALEFHRES